MANYIPLTSAGAQVAIAIESTKGTMPTAAVAVIGATQIPSSNVAPAAKETTDLSCVEFKTYTNGLKDLGGAMAITANFSQALVNQWNTFVDNYTDGGGKAAWMFIKHPGITEIVGYKIEPVKIYFGEQQVDELDTIECNYVQASQPQWISSTVTISEYSESTS